MIRSPLQLLINDPVELVIGTKAHPVTVVVREPTNADLGKYLTLLESVLVRLLRDNYAIITAAAEGKETDAQISFAGLDVDLLVATILDRDIEFVKAMSPKQSIAVIEAFLELLGWEFIKETFIRATANLRNAASTAAPAGPTWPSESSAK